MPSEIRFRTVLPALQTAMAALLGGLGLWQRSVILSRPFFEGQTMWDTTARFHVWPWPYRFVAVSNLPAVFGGLLLTIPIGAIGPNLPEAAQAAPTLLFVWFLWRWVGARLDWRWNIVHKTPWIAFLLFTLISLAGAWLAEGFAGFLYTGYLPYGFIVWALAAVGILRQTSRHRGTGQHQVPDSEIRDGAPE